MVGHLLFHVVECFILPAIIVGFSGHHDDHAARAEGASEAIIQVEELFFASELSDNALKIDLQKYGILGLSSDFSLPLPSLPKS